MGEIAYKKITNIQSNIPKPNRNECNLLIEMKHLCIGSSNSAMPLSPPNLFSSVNSTLFFVSFNTTCYAAIRQSDGGIMEEDVTNISTSSI